MRDDFRFKSVSFETKAVDTDGRTIEGYAAVFGNVDSWGDRIMPGAFTKTIKENLSRIKVAWMHDAWEPIGKPLELKEDETGLFTRSYISKTQRGNEALELAKDGVITEMSIGYQLIPKKYESNDFGGFDIYELKLREYSLVTWAANPLARVTDVKSEQISRILRAVDPSDPAAVKAAIDDLQALLSTDPCQPPQAAAAKKTEPAIDHSALKSALRELLLSEARLRSVIE